MGLSIDNEEQAKEARAALEKFYNQPVKPVSEYCEALEDWARKIQSLNKPPAFDPTFDNRQGATYHMHLSKILTDIKKSNLLARTIYGGETPRRERCPIHLGKWSGISSCPKGCESTGWLPNPEEMTIEQMMWMDFLAREERLNTLELLDAVRELEDDSFSADIIQTYLIKRAHAENVKSVRR